MCYIYTTNFGFARLFQEHTEKRSRVFHLAPQDGEVATKFEASHLLFI